MGGPVPAPVQVSNIGWVSQLCFMVGCYSRPWGGRLLQGIGCSPSLACLQPALSFLPQAEDLKNKNLILRTQLRQHGVEIIIKDAH